MSVDHLLVTHLVVSEDGIHCVAAYFNLWLMSGAVSMFCYECDLRLNGSQISCCLVFYQIKKRNISEHNYTRVAVDYKTFTRSSYLFCCMIFSVESKILSLGC